MSILKGFDLTGKVAIVTGSSTGLGQGMAIGLAEAGADVSWYRLCWFKRNR
jgi:2-dehydro-3-deoxy-D-gluconate 5-dehydrogenase